MLVIVIMYTIPPFLKWLLNACNVTDVPLLVLFIFRIVTDIQQIYNIFIWCPLTYSMTEILTHCLACLVLALFCATARQSYCNNMGVRCPSVRRYRFLGNRQVDWQQILVTGTYPLDLQTFFFCFVLFLKIFNFDFYNFFFVFVGPYGSKNFKWHLHWKYEPDSPPKYHAYSWEGSLPKLFKELRNLIFWISDKYFSFSLTCDHMGVKVSNDISSERAHQICSPKFMDTPGEDLYHSCLKNS